MPLEESLGGLVELRDDGKIREIGVCNVDVAQLERARDVTPIASVQDRYDLLARENEPVLEACARHDIAFLPWFPPAAGRDAAAGSRLERIAQAHGATTRQVALAWLIARSPATVALPGTPDPDRYEEDIGGIALELSREEIDSLA